MICLDKLKLFLFFLTVSLLYVISPVISALFFSEDIQGGLEFIFVSMLLIICCLPVFIAGKRYIIVSIPSLKEVKLLFIGLLLYIFLIVSLLVIYGSFQAAIISSYTSRTGVELTGPISFLYYPLLSFSVAYVSLVLALSLFSDGSKAKRIPLLILAFFFMLVFLSSGNRNLVLWSIAVPLALFVGKAPAWKTIGLVSLLFFVSILMASFRNYGIGNIVSFTFPPFEYWNPIVHEYGTSYRLYDLIVNNGIIIRNFENPLQSYLNGVLNLLPSALKPSDYISFSTALSSQFGSQGEGLGNSPVAEVIYNWYLPALFIQVAPIILLVFLASLKQSGKRTRLYHVMIWLRLASLGALIIASFNFWRIGFSELIKIEMSYIIAFVLCGLLSERRTRKVNNE